MNSLVLILPLLVWLVILTYYLYKSISHYQRLTKDTHKDDLVKILDEILEELKIQKRGINELRDNLQKQIQHSVYHIQKVGIVRFNPFADTGGDQSFVLAILDGRDCGIVLTSLHSRGATRWYAKNVKEGKGVDHQLSDEEEKAIKSAKTL